MNKTKINFRLKDNLEVNFIIFNLKKQNFCNICDFQKREIVIINIYCRKCKLDNY